MHPLSEIEYRRLDTNGILRQILDDHRTLRGWRDPQPATSLDYLAAAGRGGFPLAVRRQERSRMRWFRDYVQDTVLRDALDHVGIRKPEEMLMLLRMLASRTAQIFKSSSLTNELDLKSQTVVAYEEILAGLFIIDELPAWRTNRSQRLIKAPKVHMPLADEVVSWRGHSRSRAVLASDRTRSCVSSNRKLKSALKRNSSSPDRKYRIDLWTVVEAPGR